MKGGRLENEGVALLLLSPLIFTKKFVVVVEGNGVEGTARDDDDDDDDEEEEDDDGVEGTADEGEGGIIIVG